MKARTAGPALGALAMFLVAACGGHGTAALAPTKAASAPPATTSPAPSPNAGVCHHFETIAGQLGATLAAARTRPASMTAGERNGLLHAARLMDRWSKTATPVVSGGQLETLPLDLRGASLSAHLLATDYRKPSAANYVRGVASAVVKVISDCSAVTGKQSG